MVFNSCRSKIFEPFLRTIMHAGRVLNARSHAVASAKLHRRNTKSLGKRAAERLMRFITGLECNLDDGRFSELEPAGGAFQTQTPHVAAQRFTQHSSEHMMKMMRRKAGQTGELFKGQRFIEAF